MGLGCAELRDRPLASPDGIHFYWGSENHHLQGLGQLLGRGPTWFNKPSRLSEPNLCGRVDPRRKWPRPLTTILRRMFETGRQRGFLQRWPRRPYAKYSLNTMFNLADFADDPGVARGRCGIAGYLLGRLGGRAARWHSWRQSASQLSRQTGSTLSGGGPGSMAWYLFGLGEELGTPHPGYMCAVTTLWRPSRAVVGADFGYGGSRKLWIQLPSTGTCAT